MPQISRCLTCHRTLKATSPALQQLAALPADDRPFQVRVAKVADFVMFSHARHTSAKVACAVCHGPVERRDEMKSDIALNMKFCVDCHRSSHASLVCNLCHELNQ